MQNIKLIIFVFFVFSLGWTAKTFFEGSDKGVSWWNSGPMWIYILLQENVDEIDNSKTLSLKVMEWWSSNGQKWGSNTAVD